MDIQRVDDKIPDLQLGITIGNSKLPHILLFFITSVYGGSIVLWHHYIKL